MSEIPDLKRTTSKPSTTLNAADRYTVLQCKVNNLERIHNDGKKTHQVEVERLKLELARLQKANSELTERADKQKKQKEALEQRVEELKRIANTDKAEIKDLGVKLRMSEHQRSQMTAKHGDIADTKKALQSLETMRRDEMKERDKRIADLEKSLAAERKKREMAENQLKETKLKQDAEAGKMKLSVENLKLEMVITRDELHKTTSNAESTEESLLEQLREHNDMIGKVAEQYSVLAASMIPKPTYERIRLENANLQLQVARFTRKLGNTEGQVSELANLIRQTKEENQLLRRSLKHMEQELSLSLERAAAQPPLLPSFAILDDVIACLDQDQQELERNITRTTVENLQLEAELYHLQNDDLLVAYADVEAELRATAAVASKLREVEMQRDTVQQLLQVTTVTAESLRSSSNMFKQQVTELEAMLKTEVLKSGDALRKEKDVVHRLTIAVQKLRMAEDGLRAENEQLTNELTDAERFQEAYHSLSEEVEGLLARNTLAEDEAQRLSKANAEIIGHQNPGQRIMYVEKIRNELSDTKQKLLLSTRTNETMTAQNQNLQNELDMYKSVAVPHEMKLGTRFTRMAKPPLVSLNKSFEVRIAKTPTSQVLDSIPGDMTLDEIS
ncbi:hypothetical protein BDP27DRAFT_553963 [Rhodocollybia butyracea]|uniref:Uncharacterized protein n=1 Tax=Rhodocollybia butyracea TaxID=206335 RepID=A0A9P5PXM6_9AGAR|nr:hypothetical protein BDP27DRAFT_553963 [Rhodocollybia butyracea]